MASCFTATPASAVTGTPVMFTDISATPTTISYGNNTVTVTGQLDQAVAQTGGPVTGAPVPDTAVSLEYASHGTVLDTVTTDANGDFTTTATLPDGATLWLVTAAGTPYADVQIGQVTIYAKQQTPMVTLNPQPASMVKAGTNLAFTGAATVNVNGVVTPLADARVDLDLNGDASGVSATTAADGTFTLQATNVTAGGQWTAEVVNPMANNLTDDPYLYGDGTSNAETVNTEFSTRVETFSAPMTAEAHGTEKITGTVQEYNGASWIPASTSVDVELYGRQGTGSWSDYGEVLLNSSGVFTTNRILSPGTDQVQARIAQQTDRSEYLASSSAVKTIKVYDQTCFTGTFSNRVGGSTVVGGRVIDWCGSKTATFKTVTGAAQIYYRKGTSGSWTHLGSAKLGSGGTFTYTKSSALNGYVYVTYPAQGYFRASASAIHHIS